MKILFSFLAIACSVFMISCNFEKKDPIEVAVSPDDAPFSFLEKDKTDTKKMNLVGFEIDLFDEIGKRLDQKIVYKQMPFEKIFETLEANKVNASIANITVTEERKKKVDFSTPYLSTGYALVVKDAKIKSVADLKDKRLALQQSTSYEKLVEQNLLKEYPSIQLEKAVHKSELVQKLKDGYADAVFLGKAEAEAVVKDRPEDQFRMVVLNLNESNDFAIAFPKDSPVKEKIDGILKDLLADDFVKNLKKKWSIN